MSHILVFTESYVRREALWLKRHPNLKATYQKTLQLLEIQPRHPSLRLHALSGKLEGLYSVPINLSYRITIEFMIENERTILVNIGDHGTVYR